MSKFPSDLSKENSTNIAVMSERTQNIMKSIDELKTNFQTDLNEIKNLIGNLEKKYVSQTDHNFLKKDVEKIQNYFSLITKIIIVTIVTGILAVLGLRSFL